MRGEKRVVADIDKERLAVNEVLFQTFHIYKTGFRQFVGLSAISLITVPIIAGARLAAGSSLALAIFLFAACIGSVYFVFRANIAIFMLARSLDQDESLTLKESFRRSKGFCGTYFTINFLYALIIIVPVLGVALSYEFAENPILKYGLIFVFVIPLLYLFTKYYLAMPSALFAGRRSGEFLSSSQLVKGDFLQVLIITFLTCGLYNLVIQLFSELTDYVEPGSLLMVFTTATEYAIQVFAVPIGIIAAVLMYLTLNSYKGIDILTNGNENITLEGSGSESSASDDPQDRIF